jgi:hypothetical protein
MDFDPFSKVVLPYRLSSQNIIFLKAESGNKSLYATRLAINLYWAHWIMETRSFVARPTNSSSLVKIDLLRALHK